MRATFAVGNSLDGGLDFLRARTDVAQIGLFALRTMGGHLILRAAIVANELLNFKCSVRGTSHWVQRGDHPQLLHCNDGL